MHRRSRQGVPVVRARFIGLSIAGLLALGSAGCGNSKVEAEAQVDTIQAAYSCTGANCSCGSIFGLGLLQGTVGAGTNKDFELITPHAGGGFSHYRRENVAVTNVGSPIWTGPAKSPPNADATGVMALEQVLTGNIDVVAVVGNNLVHYWRDRGTANTWGAPTTIATGVTGQPGFIQDRNTSPTNNHNLNVVVPLLSGGLAFYWRDQTQVSLPWSQQLVFATGRTYQAVSLIQSNFGTGRLEVVARSGTQLYHIWRNDSYQWQTPVLLSADGVQIAATGVHSFIQGHVGTQGNFEMVVPGVNGGLNYYWRENDNLAYPWHIGTPVDPMTDVAYSSAAVIWSDYGNPEAVGRRANNGTLAAFFQSGTAWNRSGANSSGTTVWAGNVFGGEPCCDSATKGMWADPVQTGSIGIHAALLSTGPAAGKVLFFGFENDSDMGYTEVFDPSVTTPGVQPFTIPDAILPGGMTMPHAFCSGHAFFDDGRLWVAGGHGEDPSNPDWTVQHLKGSHIFDPTTPGTSGVGTWTRLPNLSNGRWYPTLTRLGDGSVLAMSGSAHNGPLLEPGNYVNGIWETLDKNGNSVKGPVPNPFASSLPGQSLELYPFQYLLPNGKVFVHSRRTSRFFTPRASVDTSNWDAVQYDTVYPYTRTYPGYGSSVLLPLSYADSYRTRILVIGGAGNIGGGAQDPDKLADSPIPATNTVEKLDLGASPVQWTNVAPMNFPRVLHTATLMPDGKVFVMGGSYVGRSDFGNYPVQTPEIYDPNANTWTPMCAMRAARTYHSTALLLPDARILTAGRDHKFQNLPYTWPDRRTEIYTPPYLLNGQPRPVLNVVPTSAPFNTNFNVTVTSAVVPTNITRAVLMSPAAVTHGLDMGQREIVLQIVSQTNSTGTLVLKAPLNANVAPPGFYMLFLLSNQGVPSVSKFIKLQ